MKKSKKRDAWKAKRWPDRRKRQPKVGEKAWAKAVLRMIDDAVKDSDRVHAG